MIDPRSHNTVKPVPEKPWLLVSRPVPSAAVRFFCCPYAGGSASSYCKWPSSLPECVELLRVQLPGRGIWSHAEPFRRMDLLIEALGEAIMAELDRPYVLFGHSFGALVAFEI